MNKLVMCALGDGIMSANPWCEGFRGL